MKMEKLNQNREPSPEDKDFWAEFAGGVEKTEQPPEQPAKSVIIKEVVPTVRLNEVYRGNALGELREGRLADIDGATARRFKRGDFSVEATLDLHGYTEDRAYTAVGDFIKKAYLAQKRCVLIITGKGLAHDDNDDVLAFKGLLKEKVPQWLNTRELRSLILAFRHPDVKLGGSGALYILLRRKR